VIRIAITVAAFEVVVPTLPLGSVAYEVQCDAQGTGYKRGSPQTHRAARPRRELLRRDHAAGGAGGPILILRLTILR
jgi:hypothetical protein